MSQLYLKDTSIVPRSGFVYKDEDTSKVITGGSFYSLVANVVQHRKTIGLNTDSGILDKIHAYLCSNNPKDFCTEGARGLGDVIHLVAKPVAQALDSALGTNFKGCWSCAKRREALNRSVSFRH